MSVVFSVTRGIGRLVAPVLSGCVVLFAGLPATAASSIAFRRLNIPDDIPAHLCTALAEDQAGFLWFGTQGGLVRFDGYEFRVYRSLPDDQTALGGSYVRIIYVATDGRLWVGTFSGGLSVFDPTTESFQRFRHDPADLSTLVNDRVEGIAEEPAGVMWIGTDGGLDRIDSQGSISHFTHDPADPTTLAHTKVRYLLVDHGGRMWVGSGDGLQRWQGEGRGFERVVSDPGSAESLAGQVVTEIFEDSRSRIWVGTAQHGAVVIDSASGKLIRRLDFRAQSVYGLSHYWVYGFTEIDGEIWVATFGAGIDVVDSETLAVIARLKNDPALDDTLPGDRVGAMLSDRQGAVWVGTWGQGIARHDPTTRAVRALRFSPGRPEGLSQTAVVRALELKDGTIWAGTNGNGVDILDRNLRLVGAHRPDPADPGRLADGSVTCLAEDQDGTAWVATLDGTLHRLVPGHTAFERLTASDGLPWGPIRAMTFDGNAHLWVAAEGLGRIDTDSLAVVSYTSDPADETSISGPAVEAIAVADDGRLWIGTTNGLNLFDPESGHSVHIMHEPKQADGLPDSWVPDLATASDGRLWIVGQTGAHILTSWDGTTAHFSAVMPAIGRDPEPVVSILEDSDGKMWLNGRIRVDPRTMTARELGPADGVIFRNMFIASRSRTRDGHLLFGSPEGLLVIDPAGLSEPTYEPSIVLTGLWFDGIAQKGSSSITAIEVEPSVRRLQLEFAALDFAAPERNLYRTRLDGFDDHWNMADASHRSLTFTRVDPGRYTLHVGGSNSAGRWSSKQLVIPVTVLPAYYQTLWFRVMGALAALGLVWTAVRMRVGQLQRRSRELEGLVDLRTAELAQRNQELEEAHGRLREASLTDPLTGLRNRRYLEQVIDPDLELAVRLSDGVPDSSRSRHLVFLLMDLDLFKRVNDDHGHGAGDVVLQRVAELLCGTFRAADHIVRWGGEEFLVVVRFVAPTGASMFAEKLRSAVQSQSFILPDGTSVSLTCSIGFAAFPFLPSFPRDVDWHQVVDLADVALYAAKHSGRNGWIGLWPSRDDVSPELARELGRDPQRAVSGGLVRVEASEQLRGSLTWASR